VTLQHGRFDRALEIAAADSIEKSQDGYGDCSHYYGTPHGGPLWRAKRSKVGWGWVTPFEQPAQGEAPVAHMPDAAVSSTDRQMAALEKDPWVCVACIRAPSLV
jgi:hypothetical protein